MDSYDYDTHYRQQEEAERKRKEWNKLREQIDRALDDLLRVNSLALHSVQPAVARIQRAAKAAREKIVHDIVCEHGSAPGWCKNPGCYQHPDKWRKRWKEAHDLRDVAVRDGGGDQEA